MSWRRFRVLFDLAFKPAVEEDEPEEDWNAALDRAVGRETPSQVTKMDLADFQKKMM